MSRADFLIKHANPLDQVAAAARRAAVLEATAQLDRLEELNLAGAEPHQLVIVRRWRNQLRQLLEPRRRT